MPEFGRRQKVPFQPARPLAFQRRSSAIPEESRLRKPRPSARRCPEPAEVPLPSLAADGTILPACCHAGRRKRGLSAREPWSAATPADSRQAPDRTRRGPRQQEETYRVPVVAKKFFA